MVNQLVQAFIRESVDVPWFHDTWDPEHPTYVRDEYITPGLVSIDRDESEDKLMVIISYEFHSIEAVEKWHNDSYLKIMGARKAAHNLEHNITQVQ